MLMQLLMQILDWLFGFITMALLARVLMQWTRAPFRNPLGQFVIAVTDWAVIPARRLIPSVLGVDLASLLLAWLAQGILQGLILALSSAGVLALVMPTGFVIVTLLALLEVVRIGLYLLMGVVIVSALLSWVNPYAPLAPLFNLIARPFLSPLQRIIPLIGGIDLSPMALLLILQVLLTVLASAQHSLFPVFSPLMIR